jgi:hypothetical protein
MGAVLAAALACEICVPRPAFGQEQSTGRADLPDIVKLKNGSLYRGTIVELVAGDHVDLRLPSGETKRWAMAEVSYAGGADRQPSTSLPREQPAPRPLVTVEAEAAKIHFESDTPETDLHIRTGDATVTGVGWGGRGAFVYGAVAHGYEHICAAPCDATLPAGTHRLALSKNGRAPVEPEEAVTIHGPSSVRGTYVDKSGTRIAGWVIIVTSFAAATGMLIGSFHTTQDCSLQSVTGTCNQVSSVDMGLAGGAVAVSLLGTILGMIFVFQHDSATIEVTPMEASLRLPLLPRREAAWIAPDAAAALSVRVRF